MWVNDLPLRHTQPPLRAVRRSALLARTVTRGGLHEAPEIVAAALPLLLPAVAFGQNTGDRAAQARSEAEQIGDVVAGQSYAERVCAVCHAIEPSASRSPNPKAPTFESIANTPGMTEHAVTVWLTTFHPGRTMPAIVVAPEDRQNVIASILSLKSEK